METPEQRMPKIDLLFPVLPPTLDGIGDHTARLSAALAPHAAVRVLTAQSVADAIDGVEVVHSFRLPPRRGVWDLVDTVRADPPDWLFVQFNQFSYGRWGLNPFLPLALWQLRRVVPGLKIAVMFHEDFLPANSWKNTIMTTWQRAQFWALGTLADHVFFSIDPWVREYRGWFPGTPVDHLPVGSNMPYIPTDRQEIRQELGIKKFTFVMGVFGSLHASRLLGHIRAAAEAVRARTDDVVLLYIGPHGEGFRDAMGGLPVIDAGRLPATEVSRHFQAMDVHLAPFMDGVSTRRGSFMTGLQHGVATVTTIGRQSGAGLKSFRGKAFMGASEPDVSSFAESVLALLKESVTHKTMTVQARALYCEHFDWTALASRLQVLLACDGTERDHNHTKRFTGKDERSDCIS